MSKILLSNAMADISGSVAGTTFQKTKYGLCAQTKVSKVPSSSNVQVFVKQSFAKIARSWDLLTQPQRDSWIAAAIPPQDGYHLFQSRNLPRVAKGHDIIPSFVTAPTPLNITVTTNSISFIAPSSQYTWDITVSWTVPVPPESFILFPVIAISTSAGSDANIKNASSRYSILIGVHSMSRDFLISSGSGPQISNKSSYWRAGFKLAFSVKAYDFDSGGFLFETPIVRNIVPAGIN